MNLIDTTDTSLGFQLTLQGTNSYLIGTGKRRLLVDAGQGIPSATKRLTEYLEKEQIDVERVLITHWHRDHTGGTVPLIEKFPYLAESIYKRDPSNRQIDIKDGDQFTVEGATLTALLTPGHAKDHMCFFFHEENALLTGDNVLGHGMSTVEDLGVYMKSLLLMRDQNAAIGYPAHGDVIPDLRHKMTEYIDHRVRREQQLLATLEKLKNSANQSKKTNKGSVTCRDLVLASYGSTIGEEIIEKTLCPMTLEILWKMARDGQVGFEIKEGDRQWFAIA